MAKSTLKKLGTGPSISDYSDEDDGLTEVRPKTPVNASHGRQPWKKLFLDFIGKLRVQTKDYGEIPLADNLYGAQLRFLDELCEGLETGQRHFVCLKARQLGISTISLALDLFWLAIHPGMQGALITDTASNKEKFRVIIDQYLSSLPKALKIKYDTSNRDMLVFSNGSVLDYLVAGVRSKRNGGLGRSRAYNFIHATECSSWGDAEGVASLMASLSEHHKDRLYIFESTARGFNLFHDMWQSAERDPETQRGIFIGWWAKESYTVDVKSELFRKYWDGVLNVEEQEIADICEDRYGVKIRPDQWAWYRWKSETRMNGEGTMQSEYPSHEREAFVATGRGFFPVKQVSADLAALLDSPPVLEGYVYHMGEEFIQTQVEQVYSAGKADLKVWEYPNEKAQYVMGIDVAYGRDEDNDRSCIQVFRCYADRLIQVAEFCSPLTETHHLAWIICHLGGNYKNCMINLEVQGPGYAVKQEMDHLKMMLGQGMLDRNFVSQPGLKDFFSKARYYLYHRPDSIGAGYVYFWKTGSENKQTIFNQYRDCYMTKQLQIKSRLLFEEMQTIVQDGFEICGSGRNKDDRCMATALAVKAWLEWMRQPLINQKRTFDNVMQDEEKARTPYAGFVHSIYEDFMLKQASARENRNLQAAWDSEGDLGHEDAGFEAGYEPSDDAEDVYG